MARCGSLPLAPAGVTHGPEPCGTGRCCLLALSSSLQDRRALSLEDPQVLGVPPELALNTAWGTGMWQEKRGLAGRPQLGAQLVLSCSGSAAGTFRGMPKPGCHRRACGTGWRMLRCPHFMVIHPKVPSLAAGYMPRWPCGAPSAESQAATGALGCKVRAFPQLERLRAHLLAFHPSSVYSEVLGRCWGWEVAEGRPARGAGPRCQPGD